jgi:hypothetical protein
MGVWVWGIEAERRLDFAALQAEGEVSEVEGGEIHR